MPEQKSKSGAPAADQDANFGAARADPALPCFGVSAGVAAVDLRASGASATVAERSLGASDRDERNAADAVASSALSG
jgi:hypothetical protein